MATRMTAAPISPTLPGTVADYLRRTHNHPWMSSTITSGTRTRRGRGHTVTLHDLPLDRALALASTLENTLELIDLREISAHRDGIRKSALRTALLRVRAAIDSAMKGTP